LDDSYLGGIDSTSSVPLKPHPGIHLSFTVPVERLLIAVTLASPARDITRRKGLDGMNRLQQLLEGRLGHESWFDASDVLTSDKGLSGEGSVALGAMDSTQLEIPHRLFVPEHFEPRYDYPLIVWLHSDDSSEWELDVVMEAISLRNYLAIAPRGHRTSPKSNRLFRWGTQIADLAFAENLVFECVDALIEGLPVHTDRIFLGGIGSAGTVAQWIGLKNPDRFAGVVSMQGVFPKHRCALSGWKAARQLPVLYMQGEPTCGCNDDDVVEAMQLAHAAGLQYRFVRFRDDAAGSNRDRLSDGSESVDAEMFSAANRFLMGIVTQTDISLDPEKSDYPGTAVNSLPASFGWN
jgi:phospholipase/carboxylesterase